MSLHLCSIADDRTYHRYPMIINDEQLWLVMRSVLSDQVVLDDMLAKSLIMKMIKLNDNVCPHCLGSLIKTGGNNKNGITYRCDSCRAAYWISNPDAPLPPVQRPGIDEDARRILRRHDPLGFGQLYDSSKIGIKGKL